MRRGRSASNARTSIARPGSSESPGRCRPRPPSHARNDMIRRLLLAVLFAAAAAVPTAAPFAPPPAPDAPIIQAGPFGISPTLLLRELGRDENVFNERDNPKGDFTFTVVPRAEVVFKPRALRVSYIASTE